VEPGFGLVKLGAVCMYPCPYILAIVCCGIPSLGAEPNPRWWFGYGSGSPAGQRGLSLQCCPPMDHLYVDWFEQN
jgi:hypothetical protein